MTMYLYKILSIKKDCDDVKIFQLAPLKEKIVFKPGQFAMLCLLDKTGAVIDKRPYSIASVPEEENIEFAIKIINGRFTSKLDGVKEGEIVGLEGPFGHFVFNNEKRAVFVAGGIGITPIFSMLRTISRNKIVGDYTLLYSCKTKKDITYENEIREMQKSGIKTVIFLTREENKEDKNYEYGRIEKNTILKYVKMPNNAAWFMCGPLAMTTQLKKTLIEIGVPEDQIKFEGWG